MSQYLPADVDYPRAHETYKFAVHPRGAAWVLVPLWIYEVLAVLIVFAWFITHSYWLLIPWTVVVSLIGARLVQRRWFVLGYEAGYEDGFRTAKGSPLPQFEWRD